MANANQQQSQGPGQIVCPTVADKLPAVPAQAQNEVNRNLALLDQQVAEANQRLINTQGQGGAAFVQNAILGPLKDKRTSTIDRIAIAIGRQGQKPQGLESLAACTQQNAQQQQNGGGQQGGGQQGGGQQGGQQGGGQNGGQQGGGQQGGGQQGGDQQGGDQQGDFRGVEDQGPRQANVGAAPDNPQAGQILAADAQAVQNAVKNRRTQLGRAASGSFTQTCTGPDHVNSDNHIVSPGLVDGAQHFHHYFGNRTTNAFSTSNNMLSSGATTCAQSSDLSAYWLPALLVNNKTTVPQTAQFIFRGYNTDVGQVVSFPQGMKILAGNAHASTADQSSAEWTCTGRENQTQKDFPNCTGGSKLVRLFEAPSCWDGKNTDSANHRTHIVFTEANGQCPAANPVPVPRLEYRWVYNVSGDPAQFALSSFADALGTSFSDHLDANLFMPTQLMASGVRCINSGTRCGTNFAGQGGGQQQQRFRSRRR